jgi:hypothetical protein
MVVQRENLVGSGAGWSPSPRPSHTTGHAFYAPGGSSESLNLGSAKTRVLSFAASHSWRPFDIGDNVRLPPAKSGTSRSFLPSTRLVQDGKSCFLVQRFGPSFDSVEVLWPRLTSRDTSTCRVPEISHGQLTACPEALQGLPPAGTVVAGRLLADGCRHYPRGRPTYPVPVRQNPLFASGFFRSSPCGKRLAFGL